MRRAFVSVVAVLLAGCGSEAPVLDGGETTGGAAPALNATLLAKAPALNVSVLHLNLAPRLNLSAPTANLPAAMALPPLSTSQAFAFNRTIQAKSQNLTQATTQLWVRITQTVVQPGPGTDPGCSALLTLTVVHNGTATAYAGGCGSLGIGAIPPGDHLIAFGSAPGALPAGLVLWPGDNLILTVSFYLTPPGAGVAAYLLAGAADRDSWVRLDGLREPWQAASPSASTGNATKGH